MRETNPIGHAYIFAGQVDLLERANAFTKAIHCLENTNEACNMCISCRVFESGNHPDTLYVTAEKLTTLGVDDIREQVIYPMATRPFHYNYKIFIINKAETLTQAAQNALLKTIEEPAPYGVFLLLTTHVEALLPTVLSRCVLKKFDVSLNENTATASNATLSHAEVSNPQNEHVQSLLQAILNPDRPPDILAAMALYKQFEPFKENKESMQNILDTLYTRFGEKLRTTHAAHIVKATRAIVQAKQALSQNGNFQLTIELMLLKIFNHLSTPTNPSLRA